MIASSGARTFPVSGDIGGNKFIADLLVCLCLSRNTRCKSLESNCRQAGKDRTRKINSRTGGGDLIVEDRGPDPSPGPGFVLPDRDLHGFCGGHRVLPIAH